jgi:hypothetical protein
VCKDINSLKLFFEIWTGKNKNIMQKITTSTPKGTEGINISYSKERLCGESLLKLLPSGWKIHFDWFQILFSDVQYKIERKKKKIIIGYNQNLLHWWKDLEAEIIKKINS